MSKPVHVASGEGSALESGGDLVTLKATRQDSIGSLLLEVTCPPGGGPPPHTDPSEELFYVLEGTFEFVYPAGDDSRTFVAKAGDVFVVPERAPHTYRNIGESNGRLVVFFRHNEHMQPFFEELGTPVEHASHWTPSGEFDFQRAMSVAAKHGIEPLIPAAE